MSSINIPVDTSKQYILYPSNEKAPICVSTPGLSTKLLCGAIFAESRLCNIFNKVSSLIQEDVIGQVSGYYTLPNKFKPTKIYCNDAGITDYAWLLESKDKPGRFVLMFDTADNIIQRRMIFQGRMYFHNLSQLHLFLYGHMRSGHSIYKYWKVDGTNEILAKFLNRAFISPTIAKNKKTKVWAFTQAKVSPIFFDPKTSKSKKKDRKYISVFKMEGHAVGKIIAAGITSHGDETIDMEPYLSWTSPSGKLLGSYVSRIV